MSEALREELNQALEELRTEAERVEGYTDMLRDAVVRLQSAARGAQERLANNPHPIAADEHQDNARELGSMTHELGRLHTSIMRMREDCERA